MIKKKIIRILLLMVFTSSSLSVTFLPSSASSISNHQAQVIASGQVELFDVESYDFVSGEKGYQVGGDLSVRTTSSECFNAEVWANFPPQQGGLHIFSGYPDDLATLNPLDFGISPDEYSPFCVELLLDGVYAYKRHADPGDYVIFRVDALSAESVSLTYVVVDSGQEAVPAGEETFSLQDGQVINAYDQPGGSPSGTFQVELTFTVLDEQNGFLLVSYQAPNGDVYQSWVNKAEVEQLSSGTQENPEAISNETTQNVRDVGVPQPSTSPIAERPVCRDAGCLDTSIDFLIVTRPFFETSLQPFIDWKSDNGYRVGLVSVEWLDQNFAGRHMAERMKTGMHTLRRDSSSAEALYVLLVGDTEIQRDNYHISAVHASYNLSQPWNVPTGFYRRISNDPADEVLPSDAYFVEDRDWDPEDTGLNLVPDQEWGQGTFDATLYLGRWSVRDTHEVANITAKTVAHTPSGKILFAESAEFDDELSKTICTWPPDAYWGERAFASCYNNSYEMRTRLFENNAPWLITESIYVETANPSEVAAFYDKLLNYDGVVYTLFHGYYNCLATEAGNCVGIETFQFKSTLPFYEPAACSISATYSGAEYTLTESLHNAATGPAIVSTAGHNEYGYYENLRLGQPVGQAFWRAGAAYTYWLNPILLQGDPSLLVFVGP
jgi:hypothetical protein